MLRRYSIMSRKKEVTHWYCGKCEKILNTYLMFARCKCSDCGRYMEALTEAELQRHRDRLRKLLLSQPGGH